MENIDLSAFSEDNFEATVWINNIFGCVDSNNSETYASNLVLKLELLVQEVNNSLEETAQQMIHNLPKVMRETETLLLDSCQLRQQMLTIGDRLNKIESESSKSMQTLISIDNVKKRMQETCKALQEADNWTTLSSDVEEVFENQDVNAIANKLIGMQNSLEILIDVPDYQQRLERLEQLKERFELMLKPAIMTTFSTQNPNLDSSLFYAKIFKNIKRMSKLKSYYHISIKQQLVSEWSRIVVMDAEENVLDWLNSMYDTLLCWWHSQINFCTIVIHANDFESTLELLSDVFIDVLSSFDPSIISCINDFIEKQSNPCENIQFLIEIKQFTYRFAKSIELSITTNSGGNKYLNKVNVELLAQTLYAPYREINEIYGELEKNALNNDLSVVKTIKHPSESLSKAFSYAKESEKRCHQLTQSVALPTVLPVLENYFLDYLQHFRCIIDDIRVKSETNQNNLVPDWSLFQLSLFTFQASGELIVQLQLFQQQLFSSLLDISRKTSTITSSNVSSFNRFDQLLIGTKARNELNTLINTLIQNDNPSLILDSIFKECQNICIYAASVMFQIALNYISNHLNDVSNIDSVLQQNFVNCEEDMHLFSLSPQEYITQIGQYLLTIPQHLEPFVLQENIAFNVALKYGDIIKNVSTDTAVTDSNTAEYLLDCITQKTIDAYIEKILKLNKLSSVAKQQLITDINYLCDVIEDLGLTPCDDFQLLHKILKASPQELQTISKNSNSIIVKAVEALLLK